MNDEINNETNSKPEETTQGNTGWKPNESKTSEKPYGCYRDDRPMWETVQVNIFRRRFGERLRFLRMRSGIDLHELFEFLGAEVEEVEAWERGNKCPPVELLPFIAQAFGLPNFIHLFPTIFDDNGKEVWLERGDY